MKVYKSLSNRSQDKHLLTVQWYLISCHSLVTQGKGCYYTHFADVAPETHRGYLAIRGRAGWNWNPDLTPLQHCAIGKTQALGKLPLTLKLISPGCPSLFQYGHPLGLLSAVSGNHQHHI